MDIFEELDGTSTPDEQHQPGSVFRGQIEDGVDFEQTNIDDVDVFPGEEQGYDDAFASPEKPTEPSLKPLEGIRLQIGQKIFRYKLVDVATISSYETEQLADDSEEVWQPECAEPEPVPDSYKAPDLSKNRYDCNDCSAAFSTKRQLRSHVSTHTVNKPFHCRFRECGKSFTTVEGQKIHEKLHLEGKQFECEICTKTFSRHHNLLTHLRLHQSGKRHFCTCCGKWFHTYSQMYEHQSICSSRVPGEAPTSERPLRFKCGYCDRMFHHRRDKVIHERVHTGERPYACGYCGKGFTQSQALTIHIRLHTGEKPYPCTQCGEAFRDSSALRKHEFARHLQPPSYSPYQIDDQ
ncbi:unnamed protein product, partial [Mesorhabditis spiculigera]